MRYVIALMAILLGTTAFGRCIEERYTISGFVLDRAGNPMPKIPLQVRWQQKVGDAQLDSISAIDGSYLFNIIFYPYSGSDIMGTDRCDAKLNSVNLIVVTPFKNEVVPLKGEFTNTNLVVDTP